MNGETVTNSLAHVCYTSKEWHEHEVDGRVTDVPVLVHRRRQQVEVVLVGETGLGGLESGAGNASKSGQHGWYVF